MKNASLFLSVAGFSACCFAVVAAAQTVSLRSSYPVEAPVALKVFASSSQCLPGRGGPGADPSAARVEIRAVRWQPGSGGKIVPLTTNKLSDEAANPLVLVSRIGAGVCGSQPGRFSVCVPRWALEKAIKPAQPSTNFFVGFFARVYDKPTVEESAYYMDSCQADYNPNQLFTNLVFEARSMSSISGDDDYDHDGLTDEEEALIGTDYAKADTDGDGLSDWVEWMYNLDPLNPLSLSAITAARTEPAVNAGVPDDSQLHVEWAATTDPHVTYTLEFVPSVFDWPENGGTNEIRSIPVGSVSQSNWAQDISRFLTNSSGFFKLRMDLDRSDEGSEEDVVNDE